MGSGYNLPDGVYERHLPGYNDYEVECPKCGYEVTTDGWNALCDECEYEWSPRQDEEDAYADAELDRREYRDRMGWD